MTVRSYCCGAAAEILSCVRARTAETNHGQLRWLHHHAVANSSYFDILPSFKSTILLHFPFLYSATHAIICAAWIQISVRILKRFFGRSREESSCDAGSSSLKIHKKPMSQMRTACMITIHPQLNRLRSQTRRFRRQILPAYDVFSELVKVALNSPTPLDKAQIKQAIKLR